MDEPRLGGADRRAWGALRITAIRHSRTREHERRISQAKRLLTACMDQARTPILMWSGGKDSTVMAHLATVGMGLQLPLLSEKDDLDYPGEVEYVTGLAAAFGASLTIVRPSVEPTQWLTEHASEVSFGNDMHSRTAALSKACFYNVVEAASAGNDAIVLGLRSEESKARRVNRATHGTMYRKRDGKLVCCPLSDWTGLDVFAYLFANEVEPLHVYRCIAFMHLREPWCVRKSWWLPGSSANHSGVTWLRHYYPSLYRRLLEWFERAQSYS